MPLDTFRQVIERAGLVPGEVIADGALHRCPVIGKERGRDGAYVLHLDSPPSGWWQNFRSGESDTWTAKGESELSPEGREKLKARVESDRKARAQAQAERYAEAARKAVQIAASCVPADQRHPYLLKKGVKACGGLLQSQDGKLVVPVLGPDGKPQSLQFIGQDGDKRFLSGGKMGGGFFPIQGQGGPMYLAEGLATGLSIHEATGQAVLVAFNTGNLKAVAQYAKTKYPNREIILAADNDTETEGNPGLTKAGEAAQAISGRVAVPIHPDDSGKKMDFNDLHQLAGVEAVREQLDQAAREKTGRFLADLDLEEHRATGFINEEPEELDWVLKDSLLTRTVGFLVGPPGAGKSTFLIELAASVATGRELFGNVLEPARRGKVLCLFCEEDRRVLHHRVHRLFAHLNAPQSEGFSFSGGLSRADFGGNIFMVPGTGQDLRLVESSPGEGPKESQVFLDLLAAAKKIEGLDLIILDPLSRLYGQNENDNSTATFFASLLERLAQETGASVICAHHVSKGAASGGTKGGFDLKAAMHQDALRGASGLTGAARWQMNLFSLPASVAKKETGDLEALDGQYLVGRVCKKNYGPPEAKFFLERKWGGVLERFIPEESEEARELERQVEEWVIAKVEESERPDRGRLTKRKILDFFNEWKHIPGCSRERVKEAVTRLLFCKELFEVQDKNGSGRTTDYLSTAPHDNPEDETAPEESENAALEEARQEEETPPKREVSNPDLEVSREVSSGEVSEVSKVSTECQTLRNMLKSLTPEKCPGLEVPRDFGHFVSACNHGSVKVSKVSPLKGIGEGPKKATPPPLSPEILGGGKESRENFPMAEKGGGPSPMAENLPGGEPLAPDACVPPASSEMWTGPAEVEI